MTHSIFAYSLATERIERYQREAACHRLVVASRAQRKHSMRVGSLRFTITREANHASGVL